jgi:hypothetical protein
MVLSVLQSSGEQRLFDHPVFSMIKLENINDWGSLADAIHFYL